MTSSQKIKDGGHLKMNYNEKMKEIGSKKAIVGIDIGQKEHYISIIETTGLEKVVGKKIKNTCEGFEKLEKIMEPWKPEELLIALEPTGHYWKSLGYWLENRGYKVVLINPYHTKRSKELYDNQRGKTDKKDSKLIAQIAREGKYLGNRLLRGVYLELRRLSVARQMVTKEYNRSMTRLQALLDEYLPEYVGAFSSPKGATSLGLLEKYGIRKLRDAKNKRTIVNMIVQMSRKRVGSERATQIVEGLIRSIGVDEGLDGTEILLQVLLRQIRLHQQELSALEEQLSVALSKTEEGEYLLKIKGVGVVTTSIVLGETGGFKDYRHFKQIEKMAGLDLVENSSGKHQSQKRISKRGRDLLRHALYRIGIVIIAQNEEFKRLYKYKVEEQKKNKMVAITAIITKLLRIMFSVGKYKLEYKGELVLKGLPC